MKCCRKTAAGKKCKNKARAGLKTCAPHGRKTKKKAKRKTKKKAKKKTTRKKATRKKKATKRKKTPWIKAARKAGAVYKSGPKKGKIMSKVEAARRGIKVPGYTATTKAKKVIKRRKKAKKNPFSHLSSPSGVYLPPGWK